MKKVKIFEALKIGWSQFFERPWYLIGLTIMMMVMVMLTVGNMLVTAVSSVIYGGYLMMMFMHADGKRVEFDDLFSIDRRWISLAAVILIKSLVIGVGILLLVLPGLYLAVKLMFAEYLVIDQDMKPMEALKASAEMTKGHWWKLFGFVLVSVLFAMLGVLVFVIGFVAVAVIVNLATISIYHTLVGKEVDELEMEEADIEMVM